MKVTARNIEIVNYKDGILQLKITGDIDRKQMQQYVLHRTALAGKEYVSRYDKNPYKLPPVELSLSDKYQKRGTGKNSQNTLLHGIIRTIAIETGNDFAVVKREVKRQALAMGYPIEKDGAGNYVMDILFNEPVPQSEADCTTVEESILID
ncbi:MAG: hypothetical protein P1P63_08420 [Treponemataceae bacterium]